VVRWRKSFVQTMSRYERMDLADGCVVVMTELHSRCRVLTVDATDFGMYRPHDRRVIDFVAPPAVQR
jgi:hypothetical protein